MILSMQKFLSSYILCLFWLLIHWHSWCLKPLSTLEKEKPKAKGTVFTVSVHHWGGGGGEERAKLVFMSVTLCVHKEETWKKEILLFFPLSTGAIFLDFSPDTSCVPFKLQANGLCVRLWCMVKSPLKYSLSNEKWEERLYLIAWQKSFSSETCPKQLSHLV